MAEQTDGVISMSVIEDDKQDQSATEETTLTHEAPARPRGFLLLAGIAVLALCVVIFLGIHSRSAAASELGSETESAAVPIVSVIEPKSNTSAEEVVLPGNTQPLSDAAIYARTNGYLKKWYFDIGAHVKQGQLLAVIDSPEVDQQLEQAKSDLKNAQTTEELAQITADRWNGLLKTNSVSKQETDQYVHELSARQATVASMKANVDRIQQLQSFEKVYAPFSGVITARNTDIGALIDAGSASAPKELFHIAATDRLRVYVAVPEVDSRAAETGAKAALTFDEFPGETFEGTIVRDSDSIDPGSRTLNVEVDLNNGDGRVKTGAYAFVHLKMPRVAPTAAEALVVPANTLLFRSEGLRVGVVRDGKATLVPITIGRDFGSTVEVIAGLRASDQVIVNPSDSLTNGTEVRVSKQ